MAGLLDMLEGDDGLLGLSLMAAAAPRAGGRTSLGEGLLSGLQAMQQRKLQQEDRQQKAAMQALQMQLMGAQIGETNAQAKQREADAAKGQQLAARNAAFQQALLPGQVSAQQALAGGGGPTQANATQMGQSQALDFTQLARQFPDFIDQIKKQAEAGDFGRQEVARTIKGMVGGREQEQQFDKFGRPVGQGLEQYRAPMQADTGGAINFLDPYSLQVLSKMGKTNTPDALLSANTAMRGQNMTDARSRDKNQIDANAVGKIEWKQDVQGNWIALPKEVNSRDPVTPITTTLPGKRETQAKNAIDILNEAEPLLKSATGSYAGAAADTAGRVLGYGTKGAQDTAKLKALEGALMMAQPRMEGPQSNLDVALYRQMAGQIGDPTVPVTVKQAAAAQVRRLHEKYVGSSGGKTVVRTGAKDGRKWVRYSDGSEGYGD